MLLPITLLPLLRRCHMPLDDTVFDADAIEADAATTATPHEAIPFSPLAAMLYFRYALPYIFLRYAADATPLCQRHAAAEPCHDYAASGAYTVAHYDIAATTPSLRRATLRS